MHYLTLFILTMLGFGVTCQDSSDKLIIGGTDAYAGQAPYQVSLRDPNDYHFCGGSIIKSQWVVTAAHCCNVGYPTTIVVGSILLDSGGVSYDVSKYINHEYFNSNTKENDIALVKLTTSIQFSEFVQSIALPIFPVKENMPLFASGWGLTSLPDSTPNTLQVLTMTSMSFSDCYERWNGHNIFNSSLCVYVESGHGLCFGDSGGPLTNGGKLHGVVSWGKACAIGYPDIVTRVSYFVKWILWTELKN